jgi:hypothetical protein
LVISCEDDFRHTIASRRLALDADLSKVHRVDGLPTKNGKAAPFSLANSRARKATLKGLKQPATATRASAATRWLSPQPSPIASP